jgi:head-tail adaptor
MTENKPVKKSQRVSMSKQRLAKTADEIEEVAVAAALAGKKEAVKGAERLETAADMAAAGAVLLAHGASDITRAADEKVMSERMAVLSDVVAVAVVDVAEGAEMLAASGMWACPRRPGGHDER